MSTTTRHQKTPAGAPVCQAPACRVPVGGWRIDGNRPGGEIPRPIEPPAADSQIQSDPTGWVTFSRRLPPCEGEGCLARQGDDLIGPIKLRRFAAGIVQQLDVFVPALSSSAERWAVDPDLADEVRALLGEIAQVAQRMFDGQLDLDAWEPPAAESLLLPWIRELGHDAVLDQAGDLRLTLHREACDGQVKIECRPNRLRMVMPLGRWPQLTPAAAAAITRLAAEANDRTRLVRIVCQPCAAGLQVEALVDLTGLPASRLNRAAEAMWKEMVHLALDGLDLVLRRLGLELQVLADPGNGQFAELLGLRRPRP